MEFSLVYLRVLLLRSFGHLVSYQGDFFYSNLILLYYRNGFLFYEKGNRIFIQIPVPFQIRLFPIYLLLSFLINPNNHFSWFTVTPSIVRYSLNLNRCGLIRNRTIQTIPVSLYNPFSFTRNDNNTIK